MYTFAQPLDRAGRCHRCQIMAVVCGGERRSYAELGARCRCLAGATRGLGLAPGLPAAGFVLVPVNSRLAPAEMREILDDAGVSVLFADAEYPGAAAAGAGHARRLRRAGRVGL